MQNYLNNLQAKPEHVRRRILIVGTAVGMVLVVGIWVVSLFFGGGFFAPKAQTTVATTDNTPGPMTLIKDFFMKITGGTIPLPPSTGQTSTTTTSTKTSTDSIPGMPQSYTAAPADTSIDTSNTSSQ
jgi:hypothetical protein